MLQSRRAPSCIEEFHWPSRIRLQKNHELIILAVTPSLDAVSLPGGNEKPPKAVILLIAVLAAQHELYFYISKRKPLPHVLQLFFSKGFKVRQPQSSTPEVWTVIDFLLLPSTRGQDQKQWVFASPGAEHPLAAEPCGCNKTWASLYFLTSTR